MSYGLHFIKTNGKLIPRKIWLNYPRQLWYCCWNWQENLQITILYYVRFMNDKCLPSFSIKCSLCYASQATDCKKGLHSSHQIFSESYRVCVSAESIIVYVINRSKIVLKKFVSKWCIMKLSLQNEKFQRRVQ